MKVTRVTASRSRRVDPQGRGIWLTIACAVLASSPAVSVADDTINPDRPDFTNGPEIVAVGHLQIEAGVSLLRTGGARERDLGELLVRLPLARPLELRLGINSFVIADEGGHRDRGLEDSEVGLKLRFAQGGAAGSLRPAAGLLVSTRLPTGARRISDEVAVPALTLALEWTHSERLGLASNLGVTLPRGEARGRIARWDASASFGFQLTERCGGFLECYGFDAVGQTSPRTGFVDAGATLLATRDIQFDLHAGLGLNGRKPDDSLGAGVSRRW